jgi:site-specific recombinase XerD
MSQDKTLTEYLDGFAGYMESSTRLLPVTRQWYRYEVAAFAALIGNPPLRDTTPRMLLDWNARFHQSGAAASTVIQKHSALRKFFGYLEEFEESEQAGRLLNVLRRQMQAPKSKGPVRPAYVLEEDRLNCLLDAAGNKLSTGIRDRAMLHFLYSTRVRNFELTGLEIKGLDLRGRMATVLGKGDKERMIVFDEACQQDLERWLGTRKSMRHPSDYVFCSVDGTRLSTAAVQGIVRDSNKKAGFRKQVWPHVFRHTRITKLLNNGMSLHDTAVMAGHTDVKTTMRYYHQEPSRLREEYDKATAGKLE